MSPLLSFGRVSSAPARGGDARAEREFGKRAVEVGLYAIRPLALVGKFVPEGLAAASDKARRHAAFGLEFVDRGADSGCEPRQFDRILGVCLDSGFPQHVFDAERAGGDQRQQRDDADAQTDGKPGKQARAALFRRGGRQVSRLGEFFRFGEVFRLREVCRFEGFVRIREVVRRLHIVGDTGKGNLVDFGFHRIGCRDLARVGHVISRLVKFGRQGGIEFLPGMSL